MRLGTEHYVDGGTRENLPVEIAMHLGVTRCYAINALPQGLPADPDYDQKDMLAILLRATAGIMADEIQLDDLARARAAGAVVISPEVNVLGVLEVDPGLLRIAADYGYIRAAEACEGATREEQRVTRAVIELRRRSWTIENELGGPLRPAADFDLRELRSVKRQLRDLVGRVPVSRLPADAARWWRRWEGHPAGSRPQVPWLDDVPPATTAVRPGRAVPDDRR